MVKIIPYSHNIQDDSNEERPLQVFILSGQSNMVGRGSLDHMKLLLQSKYNDTTYRKTLWNTNTKSYRYRDDVYVKFNKRHGYLTLGNTSGFADANKFGPELMFGWTLGDHVMNEIYAATNSSNGQGKQQRSKKGGKKNQSTNKSTTNYPTVRPNVLLLKVAYGGRSLAIDFRPPSSGIGSYSNLTKKYQYGKTYRQLMLDTRNALNSLDEYIPSYNSTSTQSSYELAGFIWLQGWNDMLDQQMVNEYHYNLANFIRDVRLDLDAPNLPFGTFPLSRFFMSI